MIICCPGPVLASFEGSDILVNLYQSEPFISNLTSIWRNLDGSPRFTTPGKVSLSVRLLKLVARPARAYLALC